MTFTSVYTRLALLTGLVLLLTHVAGAKTPFPNWDGASLHAPSSYSSIQSTIDDLEAKTDRRYFVVVIENSGNGEWPTRDYAHDLYEAWTRQSPAFNSPSNVLVVLARQNRQLGIWASQELQNTYGFKGQIIDREIVRPHFIHHAKAGQYERGLQRLLPAIEEWLQRKETRLEAARIAKQELAARELAELTQREANFVSESTVYRRSLEADPSLSDDKRKELIAAYNAFIQRFDPKAEQPDLATRRQRYQDSQTAWIKLTQEMTILTESRDRAFRHIDGIRNAHKKILTSLDALDQKEIPTGPAATFLEPIHAAATLTAERINTDPVSASAHVTVARKAIDDFHIWADYQPDAQARIQNEILPLLASSRKRLEGLIATRAKLGLETNSTAEITRLYEEADGLHFKDQVLAEKTYRSLIENHDKWFRSAWAKEAQEHVYLTRTLPITIACTIAALLILFLIYRFYRTRFWRKQSDAMFAGFNKPVVNLLDQLEDFQRRHELLPFTDPDFEAPMTGKTHALYEKLENRQQGMRSDWVTLMDLRSETEQMAKTRSLFSAKPYKALLKKLGPTTGLAKLETTMQRCNDDLTRLEAAHAEAQTAQTLTREKATTLEQILTDIRNAPLSTAPYEPERDACTDTAAEADAIQLGDPLGARTLYEETSEQLTTLSNWTERVLNNHSAATQLRTRLDNSQTDIRSKRDGGLLLTEEEGNPDPPWDQGDAEQREAIIALDGGNVELAETHIDSGNACVDEALDRVARQIAARDFCREDLPKRRAELERLTGLAGTTVSDRERLLAEFHPDSFAAVARNLDSAHAVLNAIPPLIEEADQSDNADRQRYFHAADLLEQIAERQARSSTLLGGISTRLKDLETLQVDCHAERRRLQVDLDQLANTIAAQQHTASRETLQEHSALQAMVQTADQAAAEAKPHWPDIHLQLTHIETETRRLQEQVDNEIAARQQFEGELGSVQSSGQQTHTYLQSHLEDRAPANALYQETATRLRTLSEAGKRHHAPWEQLRTEARSCRESFEASLQMAKKDIEVAEQARAALRNANAQVAEANNFYRLGVQAEARNAGQHIGSAEDLFRERRYEESIHASRNASQIASQALSIAVAAVNQIRRRQEEERRRAERARQRRQRSSFSPHSSSFGSRSRSSGSSFRSSRSSSSRSSSSHSSSRSSGGSQSSW